MNWIRRLFKDEDGAVIVIVALALVVLLGCMAMVVDAGVMYVNRSNMQNVADAASLAGAQAILKGENPEALAIDYAGKNGMKATVNGVVNDSDKVTVITPYNGDSSKIFVKCTRNVSYLFAKALGFEDADVAAKAVAQVTNPGGAAFDYAVFAGGSTLTMTGGKHIIGGSVYGRDGVSFNGNNNKIEGNAECYNGSVTVNGVVEGSKNKLDSAVPMPDFTELIKKQGIVVDSQAEFDAAVNGKTVDGPIYVNGNVTINGRVKGNGIIYASGTISFLNDEVLQEESDSICFYAGTGDITFNGGSGTIVGIIYAPNGKITVNGGPNSLTYGRLIAQEVEINGSKAGVHANTNDLESLKSLRTISLVE